MKFIIGVPIFVAVILVVLIGIFNRKNLDYEYKKVEEEKHKSRNKNNSEIKVTVSKELWVCPYCEAHNSELHDACEECGQPVSKK